MKNNIEQCITLINEVQKELSDKGVYLVGSSAEDGDKGFKLYNFINKRLNSAKKLIKKLEKLSPKK